MQRQTYERPSIVRHQMGFMNKFGKLDAVKAQTHIDGVAIHELVEQFGSPLFVFSEKTIAARVRELRDAFVRRYPRVRIAWSYKTNYLDAVCRTMHREGSWAEVVSPFEYQKALKLNVSPDHIHWNGPFKPDGALSLAIAGGSFIHVDSLDEIARVERLSEALGVKAKLAIRVNMAIEGLQAWKIGRAHV